MKTVTRRRVIPFASEAEVEALVGAFQRCTIDRSAWNHRAHLAVAMWYLTRYPESDACDLMIRGIHRFNHTKGIERSPMGGYHETLTLFWLGVGRRLVDRYPTAGALELVHRFLELEKGLHTRCYSPELLWSCRARERWVEPDLLSLENLVAGLDDQ